MATLHWIVNMGYPYSVEFLVSPLVLLIYWLATTLWTKYSKNLPPGPIGLPLVGYYPFLLFSPEKRFKELGDKYPSIYGLKLGTKYLVVLNDYEATIEAYRKDASNSRPPFELHNFSKFGNLAGMNGSMWKDHRKLFMGYLRTQFRNEPGKRNIHDILFEEVQGFLKKIDDKVRNGDRIVEVRELLKEVTNNVLFRLLFSETFPLHHPFVKDLEEQHMPLLYQGVPINFFSCFPELRFLLRPILPTQRLLKRKTKLVNAFISDLIEKHRKTLDVENPRDYVDTFLIKQRQNPADSSYCDEILNNNCQFLLLGGLDTTHLSIEWMLMLMAKHTDVQEKVCKEIMDVFGKEEKPRWEDRYRLPYTMATVFESMRWKTIIGPLSLTRCASEDLTVKGYVVPKGSHLVSNFLNIHYDEKHWKDPAVFNPEHFLEGNGKVNMNQRMAAFSFGKRECPGSQQAQMELFCALVVILQKYHLEAPPGGISFEEDGGMVTGPTSPVIRFDLRN